MIFTFLITTNYEHGHAHACNTICSLFVHKLLNFQRVWKFTESYNWVVFGILDATRSVCAICCICSSLDTDGLVYRRPQLSIKFQSRMRINHRPIHTRAHTHTRMQFPVTYELAYAQLACLTN